MDNTQETYERKLTKQEKNLVAHFGELRCEACNRYHKVDQDAYETIMGRNSDKDPKEYVYLCPRQRCIKTRAENLIDERYVAHPDRSPIGKLYHPVDGEKNLYIFRLYGF